MDQGQAINTVHNTPSPVTQSRNQKYEKGLQRKGIVKITIQVPEAVECDFKLAAERCREDRDLYPATLRSKTTGKIVGI